MDCVFCGVTIPKTKRKHAKYCNRSCQKKAKYVKWAKLNPNLGLSTATVGQIAELYVACDLLKKGYEVFKALSPGASCDLAVLKSGRLIRIEVRTGFKVPFSGKIIYGKYKKDHDRQEVFAIWFKTGEIIYQPTLDEIL